MRAQNARTAERLEAHPDFEAMRDAARSALDAPSRVPHVTAHGAFLYDLWRDAEHVRGVYRRTTLAELAKPEPSWEVVLDIDALAAEEGEPWVFKEMKCLPPEHRRCLVELSPGGGDAVEIRELDSTTLTFVDGGFRLPTAKQTVEWIDSDSVYVATDFGEGSLTESGYPRIVKVWRRGTELSEARQIYRAAKTSVGASAGRIRTDDGDIDVLQDWRSFWESDYYRITPDGLVRLDLPKRVSLQGGFRGQLIFSIEQAWEQGGRRLEPGALITLSPGGDVSVLAEPTESEVIVGARDTKRGILVEMLDNVRGRLYRYQPTEDGGWTRSPVPFDDNGSLQVETVDDASGDFFVRYESFVRPPALYHVPATTLEPAILQAQSATFAAERFQVEQRWAVSRDGTRVPYFVVAKRDLQRDGKNPTHIFSYGGFRIPLTPSYSGSYEQLFGAYGKLWLERGGVFVLANIRGGGEFGPRWHDAALLENRPRAYEDFEAVAADLVRQKITSPAHLGIEGRSNGGLLVAATMVRRPELYGAVICGMPLADMRRYHLLLAGASWMAEYGDPDDPEQWAFIETYSPYQRLEPDKPYPPIFFYSSTRDDRVHPGHARKMAARMIELGYDVSYYENIEGGHGGSSTNEQLAYRLALAYTHLWSHLTPR